MTLFSSVLDPDLEVRGDLQKNFSALWASFWSKSKGGPWAAPLDLPLQLARKCGMQILIPDTFYLVFFFQAELHVWTAIIVSLMPNMGPTIRPSLLPPFTKLPHQIIIYLFLPHESLASCFCWMCTSFCPIHHLGQFLDDNNYHNSFCFGLFKFVNPTEV